MPSQEQEEIIALCSKIELLTAKSSKHKDKDKDKHSPDKKKVFSGDQAWRNKAPRDGQSETKLVNGKEWKYCKHHGYWANHSSDECRNKYPPLQWGGLGSRILGAIPGHSKVRFSVDFSLRSIFQNSHNAGSGPEESSAPTGGVTKNRR